MFNLIRSLLFILPAERAHHITMRLLRFFFNMPIIGGIMRRFYGYKPKRPTEVIGGLKVTNRVGLAAGFDKDAKYFNTLAYLGFGFVEIGTVTPEPQPGNPKPRLFRLPKDKALINRMGFNNDGADAAKRRLRRYRKAESVCIGGNIGKNKITPNDEAVEDYVKAFNAIYNYVDYFVVNVSSPNTPGLRDLQQKDELIRIMERLRKEEKLYPSRKPVYLKIAPDLTNEQLDDIAELCKETTLQGIIATNTTVSRDSLQTNAGKINRIGNGGLSGAPLNKRSTDVIRYLRERLPADKTIIGVGGIMSAEDAREKFDAGADLVQLYTGFVYKGPSLVRRIARVLPLN